MKIGQGRDNTRKYLKDNPEFCDMIETTIRQMLDSDKERVVVEINENNLDGVENLVKKDEI